MGMISKIDKKTLLFLNIQQRWFNGILQGFD
ncbi:hypothetical protein T4A_13449 [Trichinella pseudospiralis]|uniref:Uncharacterized protein n=1 Tax=Trichinella pseudospiralis TaxID=6337 RepID=A0A0V1AI83_TRIPS|nr:hypothetical protein T4A_13449 [Trichinella pseudospiralis]